jgi:hypothetical protein
MSDRIDFSSVAKAEADAAFMSFARFTTPERAQSWYQGLIKAITSFKIMPFSPDRASLQIFRLAWLELVDRPTLLVMEIAKRFRRF